LLCKLVLQRKKEIRRRKKQKIFLAIIKRFFFSPFFFLFVSVKINYIAKNALKVLLDCVTEEVHLAFVF
jgi:hypothetical protein